MQELDHPTKERQSKLNTNQSFSKLSSSVDQIGGQVGRVMLRLKKRPIVCRLNFSQKFHGTEKSSQNPLT